MWTILEPYSKPLFCNLILGPPKCPWDGMLIQDSFGSMLVLGVIQGGRFSYQSLSIAFGVAKQLALLQDMFAPAGLLNAPGPHGRMCFESNLSNT